MLRRLLRRLRKRTRRKYLVGRITRVNKEQDNDRD